MQMTNRGRLAREIAGHLLQINAIKLNAETPFTWASGLRAPIYCDNRLSLSFPPVRDIIADALAEIVRQDFPDTDIVAGVATGAIAHGVLVAERLNLPFVYVRSAPKAHGLESRIEGKVNAGQKVVVIEDLISTGKSSLAACKALQAEGLELLGMAAIFSYELDAAGRNLGNTGFPVITLSNYPALLDVAVEKGYIPFNGFEMLKSWRENPEGWSELHK